MDLIKGMGSGHKKTPHNGGAILFNI